MFRKKLSSPGPAMLALAVLAAVLLTGGLLSPAPPAAAQESSNYNLEWHVIGGGGQPIASAHYMVNSTVGQGAARPPLSLSSHYAVSGGYWFPPAYRIYLPLILR